MSNYQFWFCRSDPPRADRTKHVKHFIPLDSLRQSPKSGRPETTRKINESWNPDCLPIQSDSSRRAACLNFLLKSGQNFPAVDRLLNRRGWRAGTGRANSQDSKIY